jgi:predicted lipoprotein
MKKILGLVLITGVLISCKKDKNEDDQFVDNFDRAALLSNVGNNIIVPNYLYLKQSGDSLYDFTLNFVTSPNVTSLTTLRNHFLETYKDWMHCSMFEFGPAATDLLRGSVNTFPCDTNQIHTNINSGTWDFAQAANIDAIGFPAIDFLLFGNGLSDAQLLDLYTSDLQAANRKNYLTDVVNDLRNRVNNVYQSWIPSGGNYIATFVASSGTDVGSSLGYLVNQLNYDYEILKNPRIGIPLGKMTLDIPLPEKCESVYGSFSLELAMEQVTAIENVFRGRSRAGVDGVGLAEYLDYLGAQSGGQSLSTAIVSKFSEIITAMQAVPGPLSQAVVNNAPAVETVYQKIVQGLVLLKTEMPSAIGILITYQDADGD